MNEHNRPAVLAIVAMCAVLVAVILGVNLLGSGSEGSGSGGSEGEERGGQAQSSGGDAGSASPMGVPGDGSAADGQPEAELMRVLYEFDITSPEELTARSDAVFVGTVERQAASQPLQTTIDDFSEPRGQYEVAVEERISGGDIPDSVIVEQRGGLREDGTPMVVEAESGEGNLSREEATDELLQDGQTYLFATTAPVNGDSVDGDSGGSANRSSVENPYQIIAQPTGNILLADGAESRQIVEAFREAADL